MSEPAEEIPIASRDEANNAFKLFQAVYGPPAYVRRARAVEHAYDDLLRRCRKQREEWLPMVRLRLGLLKALAGEWQALRLWLADNEQVGLLEALHRSLTPKLRSQVAPTSSPRRLRRALAELLESIELFNRRWRHFLPGLDLTPINELRDGYNRYYVIEKECATRSSRLAREGFRKLEPLTIEQVFAELPPLPAPRLVR